MADPDTKLQIKIRGVPHMVTLAEARHMLDNDPMGTIELPKGFESAYQNTEGDWVQEKLDASQIRRRGAVEENPLLLGAEDPRRDLVRQTNQRRDKAVLANRYDALVAMRNFVPGIQFAENLAVGKEDATRARQELISANPITHPFSQLASFVAMGAAGKALLRGTKYGNLIAAHRETIGGKTLQLIGEDALLETYLYAEGILNNDTEFIAEDWGAQVASGLLFVAPLIGSYAGRAVIGRGLEAAAQRSAAGGFRALPGIGEGLNRAADMMVFKGQLMKAGQKQAKTFHKSSTFRVWSRLFRKNKTGAKVTKWDLLQEGIAANVDELAEIDKLTPKYFKSLNTEKTRKAAARRLRDLSGGEFRNLDKIDFATSVPKAAKMHTAVRGVPDQLKATVKQIDLPAGMGSYDDVKGVIKNQRIFDDVHEGMYDLKVQDAYDRIHGAGYHNIASDLENTFHLESPRISVGKWAQKRLQAKLQKSSGWEIMDEVGRDFLADETVWKPKALARNKIINEAIDEIGNASDNLRGLRDFTDNLDNIGTSQLNDLNQIDTQLAAIKAGYRKLRQQKMISDGKFDALVEKLSKVEDKLADGKQAYFDAKIVNEARNAAEDLNLAKKADLGTQTPTTDAEIRAMREDSALGGASMLVALKDVVAGRLHGLQSTRRTRSVTFGLLAVKGNTTQEERNALYEETQLNLNELTGNPAAMADRLGMLAGHLEQSDPEMSQMTNQKAMTAAYYLAGQLPKQEQSVYGRDVPPPQSRVNEFVDKMMAVYEPFSVPLIALEGRITPA